MKVDVMKLTTEWILNLNNSQSTLQIKIYETFVIKD